MIPSAFRPTLALLVVMASAAPSFGARRGDPPQTPAGFQPEGPIAGALVPQYTDPQFQVLAGAAQSDAQMGRAVDMTHSAFNDAMKGKYGNTIFPPKDVGSVGVSVASILKYVKEYLKSIDEARDEAKNGRQDLADKKTVHALDTLNANVAAVQAKSTVQGKPLNMVARVMFTPNIPDTDGAPHQDNAARPTSPTPEGRGGPPTTDDPYEKHGAPAGPPSSPMGDIIKKIVATAQCASQGISCSGGGGHENGTPGGTVTPGDGSSSAGTTDGPLPSGTGGVTQNNPGGGTPFNPPTVGQALGINDPNSPTDAMTDARQRYANGNISDALADASRAVDLGGGADALALRGSMQYDQKNYAAAYQDASQALQLDPSNKEAAAVAHFSKALAGPAAALGPAAGASFGGNPGEAGGIAGAGRGSASALLNTSAAQLSGPELAKAAANSMRLNDLDGALALVNRGLSQDANNPALLNLRASIYARQHDYERAAADAKAGLALAPHNEALLKTLGYAQLRGKHFKEAMATSTELINLNPKDAYAFALRAHAYGSMGDRDAMMADINRAASLDPHFQATAAQMAALVQLPSDGDVLFLFPGETAAVAKTAPAAPAGRGRRFGLLVGASAFGGLLLALGLLRTVFKPMTEKITSVFTRITPAAGAAVDTARPASVNGLLPGLIRGQYEISRQIGQGGMGTVYEGTDRSLGRRVAIKKMREELRVNPAERARFVIEAKTVAALHHPSIVDIYAIAEDGPDVYLVFEYVDGKTVHELVQTSGRLIPAQALQITRASADALGYAHSRGVVHRDMKPSNVMIDAAGRVKVMDFGIARMAKDSMTRYSMTNTVVGTPPYMAPEQEQGQVRRESDVYALAVCAYEMLTGKLPFIGIGAGMLMNKINMSFVAPSRATAGLPEAIDEVFTKAFQANPDQRYRTPQEFADALESALPAQVRA
jgi:tetratricopeptide (TPR) repeat protein/tRNA A-37 threonylcarbamoyl transferase component Bud32